MKKDILFLSVKPEFAEKIYKGEKKVEIRKSRPQRVGEGSSMIFYETSPKQAVTGVGEIGKIEEYDNPYDAIRLSEADMNENQLYRYVNSGKTVLIYIEEVVKWENEVKLNELRENDNLNDFHIPLSYSYISYEELMEITNGGVCDGSVIIDL